MVRVNEEVIDSLRRLFHCLPDQPLLLQVAESELDSLLVLMWLKSIQVRRLQSLVCVFLVASDLEDALNWWNDRLDSGDGGWLRDWLEERGVFMALWPRLVACGAKWRMFMRGWCALNNEAVVLVKDIDRHLLLRLAVKGHRTKRSLDRSRHGLRVLDTLAAGRLLEETCDRLV